MGKTASISCASIIALLLAAVGCEPSIERGPGGPGDDGYVEPACVYYAPERIDILPLTELKGADEAGEGRLDAYVSLVDSAGSQIKFPVKFRFELYEQVQRSPEPKGKRAKIWPPANAADPNESVGRWFDLDDPAENNRFWRDFVRAYHFSLPFTPQPQASYILEITCLTHHGRRLKAEVPISPAKTARRSV